MLYLSTVLRGVHTPIGKGDLVGLGRYARHLMQGKKITSYWITNGCGACVLSEDQKGRGSNQDNDNGKANVAFVNKFEKLPVFVG